MGFDMIQLRFAGLMDTTDIELFADEVLPVHSLTSRAERGAVQWPARPPEMSNTAPVENEHSSEASNATSAATSGGWPTRPIGCRFRTSSWSSSLTFAQFPLAMCPA